MSLRDSCRSRIARSAKNDARWGHSRRSDWAPPRATISSAGMIRTMDSPDLAKLDTPGAVSVLTGPHRQCGGRVTDTRIVGFRIEKRADPRERVRPPGSGDYFPETFLYHNGWWVLAQPSVTVPRVMARMVPLTQIAA